MDDLQKQIQKRKSENKDFAKDFDISEYLNNKEIRDEYLAQVLKDGDKDELSQALANIEKAKTLKS
jgi:DNA-binding phage protein